MTGDCPYGCHCDNPEARTADPFGTDPPVVCYCKCHDTPPYVLEEQRTKLAAILRSCPDLPDLEGSDDPVATYADFLREKWSPWTSQAAEALKGVPRPGGS